MMGLNQGLADTNCDGLSLLPFISFSLQGWKMLGDLWKLPGRGGEGGHVLPQGTMEELERRISRTGTMHTADIGTFPLNLGLPPTETSPGHRQSRRPWLALSHPQE